MMSWSKSFFYLVELYLFLSCMHCRCLSSLSWTPAGCQCYKAPGWCATRWWRVRQRTPPEIYLQEDNLYNYWQLYVFTTSEVKLERLTSLQLSNVKGQTFNAYWVLYTNSLQHLDFLDGFSLSHWYRTNTTHDAVNTGKMIVWMQVSCVSGRRRECPLITRWQFDSC